MATLAKLAAGLLLLAVLLHFGNIDLSALKVLLDRPWTVAAAGALVLATLPLGALRWGIMLRLLGAPLPFVPLFHIQCIATVTNQFLLGPASADAVRGLYAWRALQGRAGVVAVSILADRIIGLVALVGLGGAVIALRWPQLRDVPQMSALIVPLAVGFVVLIGVCLMLLTAPSAIRWIEMLLGRHGRIATMLDRIQGSLIVVRQRPSALLAVLLISVVGHCASILAVVVLALAMNIGTLAAIDYATAVPLAFLVNALPLTAGGLGVGEAAFDRICHWLEPVASGAAYASVFFAYRAVSTLVLMVGFVSFVVYRNQEVGKVPQEGIPGVALASRPKGEFGS